MRSSVERGRGSAAGVGLSRGVRFVLAILFGGCLWGMAAPAVAQQPQPLQKSEVVRLLSGGTYTQVEVAAIVRRSCLSFRPTERDFRSFRDLGARSDVMEAIRDCAESPPPQPRPQADSPPAEETAAPPPEPESTPVGTLFLSPRQAEVSVNEPLQLMAELTAGAAPLRNVPLALREGTPAEGGAVVATAQTGAQGQASFEIPPAGEPGVRRYTVVAPGRQIQGVNMVEVRTTASPEASPAEPEEGVAVAEEPPAAPEETETEETETEEHVAGGTADPLEGLPTDDREALLAEARELSREGRFGHARAVFEHLLEGDRRDLEVLLAYGQHLTRAGAHDEARRMLQRAVGLDSSRVDALKALAFVYLWDEPAVAVRHYRRAVDLAPDDVGAWRGLARALANAGQEDEARRAARRARELVER